MVRPDHRCIWITTDKSTHLMLRSSTFPRLAISKFRNVYEQLECGFVKSLVLHGLWYIARFFRHTDDDTRRQRFIKSEIEVAKWFGPTPQLGCERLLYGCYGLYIPAEWRKQVKELMVALKPLTAAQASLMWWEMVELLRLHCSRRRRSPPALANEKGKKDKGAETECTDSDSYSTY
jgi:hypothetical protein